MAVSVSRWFVLISLGASCRPAPPPPMSPPPATVEPHAETPLEPPPGPASQVAALCAEAVMPLWDPLGMGPRFGAEDVVGDALVGDPGSGTVHVHEGALILRPSTSPHAGALCNHLSVPQVGPDEHVTVHRFCLVAARLWPDHGGAPRAGDVWGVTTVEDAGSDGPQGLRIEHVDGEGRAVGLDLPGDHAVMGLSDLEGDGRTELFTQSRREEMYLGNVVTDVEVWTARDGDIVRHPHVDALRRRGWRIQDVVDADCDGRVDLVVDPYGAWHGEPMAPGSSARWMLLAHATPKGLVVDSALAEAYARLQCPEPITAAEVCDGTCAPDLIHCAKLWGATPASLEEAVARHCEQGSDPSCADGAEAWRAMARTALPVTLR